ncbi:thiamine phosphate synthase [Listeria valentina]|uniref:thiamine phosphate synthase n=1 Tax=Listeria valentina TaxID=2705293 RepID=UPI00142FE6C9|nr:thiamine phosphate synthase [Listeria valentina]
MRQELAVYLIAGTQDVAKANLVGFLEKALQAGITCFQFREKGVESLTERVQMIKTARKCQLLCQTYGVPFFVNDDVELALMLGADGVHVGQDDRPVQEVIELCGAKMKVGLSVSSLQEATEASNLQGLDYIGVGPIFATSSKADAKAPVGLALLEEIRQAGIECPVVAIGGITTENVSAVLQAGVDGVAVISALTQAANLEEEVAKLK